MIDAIKHLGVADDTPLEESRYIRLANIITIMYAAIILILAIHLYFNYGLVLITVEVFLMSILYTSILLITASGFDNLARHLIALMAPVGVFIISVMVKTSSINLVTEYSFINIRTVLEATAIIPLVLFSFKEKRSIFLGLFFSAVLIVFFNSLHEMLGVGYEQLIDSPKAGYTISSVYYIIAYFFTAGVLLYFKRLNFQLYTENSNLIVELNKTNSILKNLVEEKVGKLVESKDELKRFNTELQQYSNTISHNLRGPVANLLGLTNLFNYEDSNDTQKELVNHIQLSAKSLDEVMNDLGKIVDARNQLCQIKEQVILSEEFEKVKRLLDKNIESSQAQISTNFQYDSIFCVRSHLNSIFYNLLSNAIKYRDPNRVSKINVNSYLKDQTLVIVVEDNGLGIDLVRFGHNLFGMYKRFHDHVEGKGLGLFLTKQQVESIGGEISLQSKLNSGTTFTITYPNPKPDMLSEQIYFESDKVTIWFDAVNYVSTLVWKKRPNSEEYREAQSRNKEIFRSYKCIGFLSDVRRLGSVDDADRKWFINNIIAGATDFGMKKFVVVHDKNDGRDDSYYDSMRNAANSRGVLFEYGYNDLFEARKVFNSN